MASVATNGLRSSPMTAPPRSSQHIWDETPASVAADLRFARGTPSQWANAAKLLRKQHKKGGGVGEYQRASFVHVDNRSYDADWAG